MLVAGSESDVIFHFRMMTCFWEVGPMCVLSPKEVYEPTSERRLEVGEVGTLVKRNAIHLKTGRISQEKCALDNYTK